MGSYVTFRMNLIRTIVITLTSCFCLAATVHAGLLDKAKEFIQKENAASGRPDTATIVAGLKEALAVGTKNAVKNVSALDGYYRNPQIKIPMPKNLRKTERILRNVGLGKEVDRFVLSMNRAAEKAAPRAKSIFIDAVTSMTFTDAKNILRGGNTAATDYFKRKTYKKLYGSFKPIIASATSQVGVTRKYKGMMKKAASTGLVKEPSVDLDQYVTDKALEGLFYMLAQEEHKIRTDPAARVTELLKKVFRN